MKANRKFREADEAVSAVIGVILMVAITVAIAATVYVYVSGMIGSSPTSTPSVQFVKDDVTDKLTVASADPGNLQWSDFNYTQTEDGPLTLHAGGATVMAGDWFSNCNGTVTIRYDPTNTLLGTWDFA